ncbi:MAG: hypothetical protein WCI11_09960 [Candidatus Methylumidiphilus sp.]
MLLNLIIDFFNSEHITTENDLRGKPSGYAPLPSWVEVFCVCAVHQGERFWNESRPCGKFTQYFLAPKLSSKLKSKESSLRTLDLR